MLATTSSSLSGLHQGECRVGHRGSVDARKRGVFVGFAAGGGQDVLDFDSTRGEGVGDQRPVTSPRDRFGAHDHGGTGGGDLDELAEVLGERGSLHVIRITAKAGVLPAGIEGILAGVPESSESGKVSIPDSALFQRRGELILAEMRMASRFRNRSNVYQLSNAVRGQHFEKFLDGQCGVADGEDLQGFSTARRYERIAESSASL